MLQQTQVQRASEAYARFLRHFPTLSALARAPLRDVLIAWRGMGYNNRALRLHTLARSVVGGSGQLPRTLTELQMLPGVGRYTAHAVLAFAYGQPVPVVDTNVRRVLSRVFWPMRAPDALRPEPELWHMAQQILPQNRAYDWNQALMDLGALVCTSRRPRCSVCPVASLCRSRHSMTARPRSQVRREVSYRGIPRRIYRGRIVEELRGLPPGAMLELTELGRRLVPDFVPGSDAWLEAVVRGLARDGLVVVAPGGPASAPAVRLAS